MNLYTIASLNKGAGAFEHLMRHSKEFPSFNTDMTTEVAIGVIAAAIRSGLEEVEIDAIIDDYFDNETSRLLARVKTMYNGNDSRLHLWKDKLDGGLQLHRGLAHGVKSDWLVHRV